MAYARRKGEQRRVRRFAHFEADNSTLYISQFDGGMARITATGCDVVPNGEDGVLFLDDPDVHEPWAFGTPFATPEEAIDEVMNNYVNDISFDEEHCPKPIQCRLFMLWLISLFFGTAIDTRPLCTFLGARGSGKTLSLQRVMQLLYGRDADVTSVRADNQDDLHAAVVGAHLVVFDNVDQDSGFLNDELAKICTGATITRRELYTTLGTRRYRPDCFVGITAHTPRFTRSDVIDRMLIFRSVRRMGFGAGVRQKITKAQRSRFFSAIVPIMQKVIAAATAGARPESSPYRLADWSTFAFMSGVAIGWNEADVDRLLRATDEMRTDLIGEEDIVVQMVDRWLGEEASVEKTATAGALVQEWNKLLEHDRAKFRFQQNWVGRRIRDALPALQKRFRVQIEQDPHIHAARYTFRRLNGEIQEPKSIVREPVPEGETREF